MDIAFMYASCSYGKQYEELLQTAKHLSQRWYAMVKFCETRFAQPELMVYKNFEKNYYTYRTIWSGDAVAVGLELDAETIVSKVVAVATPKQQPRQQPQQHQKHQQQMLQRLPQ
jgi:hypothetical protein